MNNKPHCRYDWNTDTWAPVVHTIETVEIIWSESPILDNRRTMKMSLSQADSLIAYAAADEQETHCYSKTKFIATFTDGDQYEGRVDVNLKCASLSEHLKNFYEYCKAGISSEFDFIRKNAESAMRFYTFHQIA